MTIIIPSYDQVSYLPEAIESALSQTVPCNVIVVDDGSTDGSLEVARKYEREEGIQVISQVNKGLASARNTGIMNAEDEWLIFLDADDILLDTYAEKVQLVDGDVIAPSFRTFGTTSGEVILMPSPSIADFKMGNRIGYCAAIKRSVLLEVGGYNPKMVWGAEDYDLWFDLLKRGKKIVTIPEVLWLYRTKEQSMWTETQKHHAEFMSQIKKNHYELFR